MRNAKAFIFLFFLSLSTIISQAQNKPAYVLYNSKGQKVSYDKMIKKFKKADVILFGEYHDNPISHWLEYEVTKDAHHAYDITLGAEMMESDNQEALNKYLKGEIDQTELDSMARLWSNYKTDYKPIIDFAKDSGITFVATNIPRRYARMVSRGGFEALDTLSIGDMNWMAPMPIAFQSDLPSYQKMLTMMGDHGTENVVKAQAMKDATMAHFIMKNVPAKKKFWKKSDKKFIHFNGAYHSDYHEGIEWYIHQINKKTKVLTITTITSEDPTKLAEDEKGRADFIISVDEDMTKTY